MTSPLLVQRLSPTATLPARVHATDAGYDLSSDDAMVLIQPGERTLIGTGLAIALPEGTVGLIHPRSGLAGKQGITVLNAPGTVDSGFRGEWRVILINHGSQPVRVSRGDRIAQLVVQEYLVPDVQVVDHLPGSDRGTAGFGSTGVASVAQ